MLLQAGSMDLMLTLRQRNLSQHHYLELLLKLFLKEKKKANRRQACVAIRRQAGVCNRSYATLLPWTPSDKEQIIQKLYQTLKTVIKAQ